mgnify:CR=1 FL=1
MAKKQERNLIVGLDIGTSKIVALVGEINHEDKLEITLGSGSTENSEDETQNFPTLQELKDIELNDISFEDALLDYYPDLNSCLAFDGTVNSIPRARNAAKIHFFKKNLGHINGFEMSNLEEYIQPYENIFMKIDIEGAEVDVLNEITDINLSSLRCVSCEFHKTYEEFDEFQNEFGKRMERLGFQGFTLYHGDGNLRTLNFWKE